MEETKETSDEEQNRSAGVLFKRMLDSITATRWFSYLYMISLLMYILICGYFLFFSGSLFIESIANKWYSAEATEIDQESFLLGYLYGFPSLLGVIGGIFVMATQPKAWFKFKVLFFIPAAIWSTLLVFDLLRRPGYYGQLIYHVPAMLLCLLVLFGVLRRVRVPYLDYPAE